MKWRLRVIPSNAPFVLLVSAPLPFQCALKYSIKKEGVHNLAARMHLAMTELTGP